MLNLFLLLFFVGSSLQTEDPNLVVYLPNGPVRGAQYQTDTGKIFYGFRGIPYAEPPVGELRFEAPQPAKPWSGIRDGTNDGKSCVNAQYFDNKDKQSEDCLFINVYTPNLNITASKGEEPLSVLVWIHGGAFTGGDSTKNSFGPEYIIEEDVVLVTLNYRVGPFGFLSTADTAILGNAGLKDQNLAIRWAKDNVQFFGGNPEKITIFGESAGGTSTGLQLMSEKSKGLFRGAIVQSGGSLEYWGVEQDPRSYAFLVAESIASGDYGNDTQKLKTFLKSRSADEIQAGAGHVMATTGRQVWPVLEAEHDDAFVTKSHYEQMNSGNFVQVPTMIGMIVEESLLFLPNEQAVAGEAAGLDANPVGLIPNDLHPNDADIPAIVEKIRNFYFPNGGTFSSNWAALAEYKTVQMFSRGILKQAELESKYVPVYLYQFAYYGRSWIRPFIPGVEPVGHAAELPFLFKIGGYDPDPNNMRVQRQMVKLWANFAKFLNPTPTEDELLDKVTWPKVESGTTKYLNINKTLEIRSGLRQDAYDMWNEIFNKYGRKPFVTF